MVQPTQMHDQKILKNFKLMISVDSLLALLILVVMELLLTAGSNMIYYANGYDYEKRHTVRG
jgi:hypothetical protein